MCLTGRLPFSNYCVSSLAAGLEFIFTLCVSPCPGILILDVVQTRSFLDWSHTGAFDFSRLCLYQHWSWGQGGSSLNLIQALESIVILETHECTSSVSTWYRKTVYDLRFWHDDAWRESRASLVEEWNFMLDIRLGCASICKRVVGHIHWEFFFGAATFLFVLDSLCLFWQRSFLVSISGRPLLLFH